MFSALAQSLLLRFIKVPICEFTAVVGFGL